jgi:ParB family chromosome partitioning protein
MTEIQMTETSPPPTIPRGSGTGSGGGGVGAAPRSSIQPAALLDIRFSSAEIRPEEIDWREVTFRITYGRPQEALRRSIRALGILQPPVLQPGPAGRLRIVSGRRRLLIMKEMGLGAFRARLADPDQTAAGLFLFNLHDNLGTREFNPVEQALAVKGLSRYLAEEEVVRNYLPLVGLPPHPSALRRYRALAEVSPHFWPAFAQGRLFPEVLDLLDRDFQPWTELLLTLCLALRFGFQKQKELLEGLQEMILRRSVPLETLLRHSGILDLLSRESLTAQQKGENWRRSLRTELYPTLAATEKAFSGQVKEMDLDERTRLKPPPFFEGSRYELVVQFSDSTELEASLNRVQRALEAGKLDDLP